MDQTPFQKDKTMRGGRDFTVNNRKIFLINSHFNRTQIIFANKTTLTINQEKMTGM